MEQNKLNYMVKLTGIKKRTAIFISGNGSNMRNLVEFSKKKNAPIHVDLVISSNKKSNVTVSYTHLTLPTIFRV